MLTYRNTNIFFALMALAAFGYDRYAGIPIFVYPLLLLLYSLVVFYGCYFIDSNFFLPVFCAANTKQKLVAISFDDGPATNYTPQTLDILKSHGIPAAFFCIGSRIADNEQVFARLVEDGHLIGNHSYSHGNFFDLLSYRNMAQDLKRMDDEMQRVTGLRPKLFRPPYGVINPNLKKAIVNGGYTPVGWSVRSLDTVAKDKTGLLKKVADALKPGAVFLFHDTSKITLDILPAFINVARQSGYEFVRLDKLLDLEPYA